MSLKAETALRIMSHMSCVGGDEEIEIHELFPY